MYFSLIVDNGFGVDITEYPTREAAENAGKAAVNRGAIDGEVVTYQVEEH